eukprot:TRINITY_DN16712_c0_g1_i1.p1 TRINITY_DN16712_c0_g1~~TRINITY_DN16712_c0_g1_i1.p1  ORF type:complete len:114 (-),score=17.37 TRINITY_DN16712_c0_g1_i1:3-344(-)
MAQLKHIFYYENDSWALHEFKRLDLDTEDRSRLLFIALVDKQAKKMTRLTFVSWTGPQPDAEGRIFRQFAEGKMTADSKSCTWEPITGSSVIMHAVAVPAVQAEAAAQWASQQ